MIVLKPENILLDCPAASWEEVIHLAVERLVENGYVDPVYEEDVIRREREYPTGLPTDDVFTALPHAFSENAKKTGVCVVRLSEPVAFRNMADPDETLPVEMAFVLSNATGGNAHLDDLQELMGCFSREGLLLDLKNAPDAESFLQVFQNREEYPEA